MTYLDQARLQLMHQYWNAANYLTVGQIYLQANPCCENPYVRSILNRAYLGIGEHRQGSICCMCISTGSSPSTMRI